MGGVGWTEVNAIGWEVECGDGWNKVVIGQELE